MDSSDTKYVYRPKMFAVVSLCMFISFVIVSVFIIHIGITTEMPILFNLLAFPIFSATFGLYYARQRLDVADSLNVKFTSDRLKATHVFFYDASTGLGTVTPLPDPIPYELDQPKSSFR